MIASLHALMSKTFLPPASMGRVMVEAEIGGGASEFHRKVLICVDSSFSYFMGIPCAAVMN